MLRWSLLAVLLCIPAYAQTPPLGSRPVEIVEIKPDTVIATVNGKPFTAGEFEMMVPNLSPDLRELAATKPKEFLEQYALGLSLQAEAEKMKLEGQWPYRQRIADARRQVLVEGVMAEKAKALTISPEDVRKIYEARGAAYRQATAKVIFCSRLGYAVKLDGSGKTQTTPAEALVKAEKAVKELRKGRDFAEAAREYSDDVETAAKGADFPYPIRANSANVPQQIRDAVLSAKTGDLVGPVEHNTGWYIFRIEDQSIATLDEVRSEIEKEMRDEAVRRFVEDTRKRSIATLDHDAFWSTFLAANKEAQERREKQAQTK